MSSRTLPAHCGRPLEHDSPPSGLIVGERTSAPDRARYAPPSKGPYQDAECFPLDATDGGVPAPTVPSSLEQCGSNLCRHEGTSYSFRMASILDIARHAGVPIESVIRVMNSQPVNDRDRERVLRVIDDLGFPHRSENRVANAVPTGEIEPDAEPVESASTDANGHPDELALERARGQLVDIFEETAAHLESQLQSGVGSAVEAALRAEVEPVAERFDRVLLLCERLVDEVQELQREVHQERRERIEDLGLLVDLISTSWQSADRRMGRVDRKLERLERR